ncbi:MAG: S9 family peptidase [Chloroflexota bacterium]
MFKRIKQFGTWPSPISAQPAPSSFRFMDVVWDTEGDILIWSESRGGVRVLVAQTGHDAPRDLTDGNLPIAGRVGYGGGDFTVHDGTAYFVGTEKRLYRVTIDGGVPRPITPAFGGAAAPRVSSDGRWIAFVHTYEDKDGLALVDVNGAMWPQKLVYGTDFVMQPAWHPAGKYIAYIAWHHPQMPWDGAELHLAQLDYDHSGKPYIRDLNVVAGDENTAIFQPEFSPDGRFLSYISNATGYGQLYLYDLETGTHRQLTDYPAEHAMPAWIQGMRTYGWTGDSRNIYFLRNTGGFYTLNRYDMTSDSVAHNHALNRYTGMQQIAVSARGSVAMIASSFAIPPRIITYMPQSGVRVVRRSQPENLFASELSEVHALEWAGHDAEKVYGLYYAPNNGQYEGTGLPPLIVYVHGGPTSQKVAEYDHDAQFFATRGYAVLLPNHRGSTGYGREYMLSLRGNWGYLDVEDCASGAQYLVDQGLADPNRIVIIGGSAGGYTVLQSLVRKPGFYRAGISRYGIANQFMLVQETHKFESRYNDSLLGVLPDAADLYRERSPLFNAAQIRDPLLIFQGDQDNVVPKSQSDSLVAALRSRGVPHEYHVYEGEGHGFRKPETIKHYYETILKFLERYVIYV